MACGREPVEQDGKDLDSKHAQRRLLDVASITTMEHIYKNEHDDLQDAEVVIISPKIVADLSHLIHALRSETERGVKRRLADVGEIQEHVCSIAVDVLEPPCVEDVDALIL